MNNQQKRQAQLLLMSARDEEKLLQRPNLTPQARRLIADGIQCKLDAVAALRTGRPSTQPGHIERGAEVYR